MIEDALIASCEIFEDVDPEIGPATFYRIKNADGETSERFGPFKNMEAAETAFTEAMEDALKQSIIQQLGLEE